MARKSYDLRKNVKFTKDLDIAGSNTSVGGDIDGGIDNAGDYTLVGDLTLETPTKIDKPHCYESNFVTVNDTLLADQFDITTGKVGAGTNAISGHANVLTTDAHTNDNENTIGEAIWTRAKLAEIAGVLNIDDITTVLFDLGFFIDANNHVLLQFNSATDTNLMLQVTEASAAERIDTGIPPVNGVDLKIKIIIDALGVPVLYINDVLIDTSALTKVMTAAAHKSHWLVTALTTAARVLTVSYVKIAQA